MLNPLLSVIWTATTTRYVVRTKYLKKSKLKTIPIYLDGIRSQVMFTSWSCNLMTISFAINGIVTLLADSNDKDTIFHSIFHHKLMLRFALIIFEISAPTSMLVSFVVRYGKLQKWKGYILHQWRIFTHYFSSSFLFKHLWI